jgi:2-polyprenyl-6-methoxyphenol hydroxylase-like FAD-dependent oxidoreductase
VVIGGSIAGLLSARAAADAFDDVLVLERGELPDDPIPRSTAPQGAHAHGLLAGGLDALEDLLPGLTTELMRSGCPTGDNLRDAAWIFGGRRLAIGESGVRGMTLSRPLLESTIRDRVRRLPNVQIRTNVRCHGLVAAQTRITGVRVAMDGVAHELAADLVVDASGRNSKLIEWLVELGFPAPPVDEVEVDTHYVTRVYSRRPQHLAGGIAVAVVSDPQTPRGGIALALDDRSWIVSQYSIGGTRPPRDHAGFVEFSRTLPGPQLTEILGDAEPLGEAATLRFPSSLRRRYERVHPWPDGLVVVGDAMASFHPTFGQGITVAAKQALILRELGARIPLHGVGREFLQRAARIRDIAWNGAVGRLLSYPGVVGRPTLKMRLAQRYLPRVIARAHDDVVVATALLEVMQFLAPPESLFEWRVLRRVFGPASSSRAQIHVGESGVPGARTG